MNNYFDSYTDIIIIIDNNNKIINVNKVICNYIDIDSKEQLVNEDLNKYVTIYSDSVLGNNIYGKIKGYSFLINGHHIDNTDYIRLICRDITDCKYISNDIQNSINKIIEDFIKFNKDVDSFIISLIDEFVRLTNSSYGYMSQVIKKNNKLIGQRCIGFSSSTYNEISKDFTSLYNIKNMYSDKYYAFTNMDAIYSYPLKTGKTLICNNLLDNPKTINNLKCPFKPKGNRFYNLMIIPLIVDDETKYCIALTNNDINYNIKNTSKLKMLTGITTYLLDYIIDHDIEYKKHKKDVIKFRQAIESKSIFLANISHEIRNPMNGIYGMLSFLQQSKLSKDQKEQIDICINSCEALMNILNDVLTFTKSDSNKIVLEYISFDLRKSIEEVICLSYNNIPDTKNLSIVYLINYDVPTNLIGDPARLKQILLNLIGNAIKFTSKGYISLEVSLVIDKPLTIQFEITDTGIGMTQQQIDKLFIPFIQANSSTTRKYGGTGLGLAICKNLVELYGGKIWVQSKIGRGSSFFFTGIFTIDNNNVALSQFEIDIKTILKDKRIYVIDDNMINCLCLKYILQEYCDTINYNTNSLDGISDLLAAQYNNINYDILLVDYHMPITNGIQTVRIINKKNIKDLKIIMVSSQTNLNVNDDHINDIISKPIRKNKILRSIYSLYDSSINDTIKSKPKKIYCLLVVDDNKINRTIIVQILQSNGYNTHEAENGLDALNKIKCNKYDCIITDIHMPMMDGNEMIKLIRKDNNYVTIFVITADITINNKTYENYDIAHLFHKPIKEVNFINIIDEKIINNIIPNVLIADDNQINREVMKKYLSDYNCNIIEASNGKIAIEKACLNKIDLIIMDLKMPVIDGIEASSTIKENNKHIIIIGVTGDSDCIKDCMNAGMKKVLIKPVTKKTIIDTIINFTNINKKK
jgi:signal transduction histidine kinase/response regulator RpfG family c-di-GMP phosphodiesterase